MNESIAVSIPDVDLSFWTDCHAGGHVILAFMVCHASDTACSPLALQITEQRVTPHDMLPRIGQVNLIVGPNEDSVRLTNQMRGNTEIPVSPRGDEVPLFIENNNRMYTAGKGEDPSLGIDCCI